MSIGRIGFSLVKSLLHKLDAEQAHKLTIAALKSGLAKASRPKHWPRLETKLFGHTFANPLGLAPGFDKNAEVPDAMLAQGFGFVEVGTVTPLPQSGSPRPRLFRLLEDQGVINRMGFNNAGHAVVRQRLEARRKRGGVIGINIGANKDSSDRIDDYVQGISVFADLASYITINISSPNTPGLRNLQGRADLQRLLDRLNKARKPSLPMLLKIAPDLSVDELQDVADVCEGGVVDGVIISNTTLSRPQLCSRHAKETGGLSGKPLHGLSTQQLALFYKLSNGRIPLIGVGGIHNAETAWAKIVAGASLIQLYSALVFKGPALIDEICQGLDAKLQAHGFNHIAQAVGFQNGEAGK